MDIKTEREIFKPIKIGSKIAKNRIALSPMGVNLENADGSVNSAVLEYFGARARGGAGIIITGSANVSNPAGRSVPTHLRLDKADYIPGWERMAEEIHRYGSLLIVQLMHAGNSANPGFINGYQPEAPSAIPNAAGSSREMSNEEVKKMIQAFITAAVYAKTACVDGVEIHGGHAYLVNDFLSPATNHRTDEYGGSLENRARFATEIIAGIKAACGPDFICGIRLGIEETVPGGYGREEGLELAKMMERAGADYICASIGHVTPFDSTRLVETHKYPEASRIDLAEAVKAVVNVPVFTTGKLRNPDLMDSFIRECKADVMCLGRSLICDADWANKVKANDLEHIRPCINCLEGCIVKVSLGQPLQCAVNPIVGKEYRFNEKAPAELKKNIVIVGGGVAGMETARAAAQRGHKVTLLEKSSRLGGQINYAKQPPHKSRMGLIVNWYEKVLPELGVNIRLDTEPCAKCIKELQPDQVIVATGAQPVMDKLQSTEPLVRPWDILDGKVDLSGVKTVAVLGGGMVGCETAEYLVEKGKDVTVIEMLPMLGNGASLLNFIDIIVFFGTGTAVGKPSTVIKYIDADGVHYTNEAEGEQCLKADMYVCAVGQQSHVPEFVVELEKEGIPIQYAGDAKNVSKVFYAIRDGFYAGYDA